MATDEFRVTHESLHQATNVLPDNVSALGDTRQTLLSRQVPASAFGDVDFSAQAGQIHAGTVQKNAGELEKSQGRLDTIIQGIGRTTDQAAQMDERQARGQRERNTELTQVADRQFGQRDKALAVLKDISEKNPVSVATVAKGPLEKYVNWAGDSDFLRNFQSGKIGDHYANDVADILAAPPTDRNLRLLAQTETPFWQSDDGSTIGGLVSANGRYSLLYDAREAWFASMPFEDEIRLRAELNAPRD